MDGYRGNAEEIIQLTFPGSVAEGEKPPPSFTQIDDVVKSLEWIVNRDLFNRHLHSKFQFCLVGAKLGSLEVWIQLIEVSAAVISSISDAPAAVRSLMQTLTMLKAAAGSADALPQMTPTSAPPEEQAITVIDKLRRSVRRAGSIRIETPEMSITLTEVDFVDARRLPRLARLPDARYPSIADSKPLKPTAPAKTRPRS